MVEELQLLSSGPVPLHSSSTTRGLYRCLTPSRTREGVHTGLWLPLTLRLLCRWTQRSKLLWLSSRSACNKRATFE